MAIYDRWYKTERQDGTRKKVRSSEYGCKERWQVRWRDEHGRQRKKSFARKLDAEPRTGRSRRSSRTDIRGPVGRQDHIPRCTPRSGA